MSIIPHNAPVLSPTGQVGIPVNGHPGVPEHVGTKTSYASDEAAEFTIGGQFGANIKGEALGSLISEALQSVRMTRTAMLAEFPQPENSNFTFDQVRDDDTANDVMNQAKTQLSGQLTTGVLKRTSLSDQAFLALIK